MTWRGVSVLMCIVAAACSPLPDVPFKPVYREGDALVRSDRPVPDEFQKRIEHVLRYYGVPLKVERGALFIPRTVADDLDTMWNYTTKANDPQWIATHPLARHGG